MQHTRRALLAPFKHFSLASTIPSPPTHLLAVVTNSLLFPRSLSHSVDDATPPPPSNRAVGHFLFVTRRWSSPLVTLFHHDHTYTLANAQHINRLLYRARQRGWLELDLLVGMWAESHIDALSPTQLKDLELLLDQVRIFFIFFFSFCTSPFLYTRYIHTTDLLDGCRRTPNCTSG